MSKITAFDCGFYICGCSTQSLPKYNVETGRRLLPGRPGASFIASPRVTVTT